MSTTSGNRSLVTSGARSLATSGARPRTALAHLLALAAAPLAAACSGAPAPAAVPGKAAVEVAAAEAPPSPARYFLTSSFGASFDEGTDGAAVPRRELAIVRGRRAVIDGGAIAGVAPSPQGLVGLRSLPASLGGGFLVWSDIRTFHAKDFLGDLQPVAEIGPTAGTRPWFGVILLRADRGMFALDLKARSVTRWRPHPGVVDALAADDKRGLTLDLSGRVRATVDGGKTWTDVTATHGVFANALRSGSKGAVEVISFTGGTELQLAPGAAGVEVVQQPARPSSSPYNRRYYGGGGYYPQQYIYPLAPEPTETAVKLSQQLAPDSLGWAATAGAILGGERLAVGREMGISILSLKTGAELVGQDFLNVQSSYSRCQPLRGGPEVLLACAHEQGAQVLVLDGPAGAPKLEATFPDQGGAFVTDDRGHLAYTGRCGRTPPSVDDFGERVARRPMYDEEDVYGPYGGYNPDYEEPMPEEPPEKEKPATDDRRVCVRLSGGAWIEHRLTGDDAKDLYRWVLGDDGAVTALLLKGANPAEDDEKKDGEDDDGGSLRRRLDEEGRAPGARGGLLAAPTSSPRAGPAPKPAKPSGPPSKPPARASKPSAAPAKKPAAKAAPAPKEAPSASAAPVQAGIRTVRLDPADRGLKHGKWTRVAPPQQQAPWRSADTGFWLEEGGKIRGWVRLPDEDGEGGGGGDGEGEGGEPSPIAEEMTGRFAGARISPEGKVTVLPLPAHTRQVLFGGRFGLARSEDDSGEKVRYFETTDGGAKWTEVVGPPLGDFEELYEDSRWPACSAVGCSLASGLVRVGWGSPKPPAPGKEKNLPPAADDPFPVPRLPRVSCRFDGEPETFPPPPPKGKRASPSAPPPSPGPSGGDPPDDPFASLPPDMQEMMRRLQQSGAVPPGLFPPGVLPGAPPAGTASPSAGPAKPKAGKPSAPPKAPPPRPADVVSVRTKPGSPLGQLKDKSWIVDFLAPFAPGAPVKHLTATAGGLEKLTGSVLPVVGDRGVELLLTWDRWRTVLGGASAAIGPFEHNGRLSSAASVTLPAPSGAKGAKATQGIVALDEDRRVLVLLQADASRAILRAARIPDPARGHLAVARRTDAPGVALVWYSAQSGEVLVGEIDFARAEIGPLAALASLGALTDGGLPACAAPDKSAGPVYQLVMELALGVKVDARSGKTLFNDSAVASTVLVRAAAGKLCALGVEVRGGGRPIDLTATFGPKGAASSRSQASAEDPTKITTDKLSCLLTEPETR